MEREEESRSILRLLVETTRTVELRVLEQLGGELRPSYISVFRYLEPEGSRIRDLADAAGMTAQAMGELVGKVRDLGLVDVTADPDDRRARLVRLTDAGKRAVGEFAEQITAVEDRIAGEIGVRRLDDLRALLSRVDAALADPVP